MRILTFKEFTEEPAGVLFCQVTGFPHQPSGLYRKGKSWKTVDVDPRDMDSDDDSIPSIEFFHLTDVEIPRESQDFIYPDSLEDEHRFHVYEVADLDWLAGVIDSSRIVTVNP